MMEEPADQGNVAQKKQAPLISLCMITKDEHDFIEACLDSVVGVADEIVIYDTGSTDDTVALARAKGATVIEGFWDDDFGRARNAALEHCTGKWVLHLDADEVLQCDGTALRTTLGRDRSTDTYTVDVRNLGVITGEYNHEVVRVFRRRTVHWSGRLHEQNIARNPGNLLTPGRLPDVLIEHYGYAPELVEGRDKLERNIRISRLALETDGTEDHGLRHLNLCRSLQAAERVEEALEAARIGHRHSAGRVRQLLAKIEAELLISLRRFDEIDVALARMIDAGCSSDIIAFVRGSSNLQQGLPAPEFDRLLDLDELRDDVGRAIPHEILGLQGGLAAFASRDWAVAAERLSAVVRLNPHRNVWMPLVTSVHNAPETSVTMDDVVGLLPEQGQRSAVAQVLLCDVEAGEDFGQSFAAALGSDPRVVGFAVHHAVRLDVERALPWATLIRDFDMPEHCPVLRQAKDMSRPPIDRFTAALVAHKAFDDAEGWAILNDVSSQLSPEDEPLAAHLLEELAPDLVSTERN